MSNHPLASSPSPRLIDNAPLIVILLLLIDSLHFVFARLLLPHLPPTTSALYVLSTGTIAATFLLGLLTPVRLTIFRRYAWFFLSIGFLVATSTVLNYTAVAFIDPGTASLLSKTSILFGVILGLLWLRERLTTVESVGSIVAVIGVFIITFQPGDYLRLGSVMVLVSALMYAVHAALVKRHSVNMSLAEFFLFRLACTTGFLFLFALGRRQLIWPSGPAWIILFLNGTVGVVMGRGLYYLALRRLKLTFHSIVLTLSPVVTIGWTLLLFGINPNPRQLLGGLAVIAGVLAVTVSRLETKKNR
jgi:drug/metabolite transporter (DMT)-like permease